jgi:transmembrane sensor
MSRAFGASSLMNRIRRAAVGIDPALTDRDVDLLVEGTHQRRRRRTVRRIGAATGVTALTAVAVMMVLGVRRDPPAMISREAPRGTSPSSPLSPPGAPPAPPLRLADGSVVTHLDAAGALSVIEDSPARVTLDLRRGRERFDVVPMPSARRSFRVRAGEVTVTVVGTVFTMERVADRIGVSVERGTVRVDWGRGARPLHAGDSGWFPPLVVGEGGGARGVRPAGGASPARGDGTAGGASSSSSSSPSPSPSPSTSVESAEQLLAAADAARVAGHAEEGAALLARLLRDHRDDPRAPLAAFTLGRLLMMELARPREAAAAFAQVRALQPDGPFAEDALAREAEAYARAGDTVEARSRARDYLGLYPNGRRAAAARALGGPD